MSAHRRDRGWLDEEFELPSEELLAWLAGGLAPAERERVARVGASRPELVALARGLEPARRARRPGRTAALLALPALLAIAGLLALPDGRARELERAVALFHGGDLEAAGALLAELHDGRDSIAGARPRSPHWSPRGAPLRAGSTGDARLAWAWPEGMALSARPALAWSAAEGAGPFRLRVEDEEGVPVLEWTGSGSRIDDPRYARELEPGAAYRVVLEDLSRGDGALVALFTVVAEADRRRIEEDVERAARSVRDPAVSSFLRARELARSSARGEARAELGRLFERVDARTAAELRGYLERCSAGALLPRP